MKTLKEHNDDRHAFYLGVRQSNGVGIECPECKSELYETCPGVVLTSIPPQIEVHCEKCGWNGRAIK